VPITSTHACERELAVCSQRGSVWHYAPSRGICSDMSVGLLELAFREAKS
jgi:hypothetical protein